MVYNYPQLRYISDISNAKECVITFTEDHYFTPGEIIGLRIAKANGMGELNQKRAKVLSVTNDSVTTDLDTLNLPTFVYVSATGTPAHAVPAASGIIPSPEEGDDTSPGLKMTNIFDTFDRRR